MTSLGYIVCVLAPHLLGVAPDLRIPFEKYTLPSNGLEVILSEDHALPLVSVNIWYHAGPINEAEKRTGFAHLFEHLMFQGSQHVGDDQHLRILESHGASVINGTTSFDRTNFFETVPSNNLELVLWLESDRMGFLRPAITQANLDKQRDVVMNERRQSWDNRPYGPSDEKLVQSLFQPHHPYYGVIIGSIADLEAATLADVQGFYERYYAPANATLVIAGDFDAKVTKSLVDRYFGSLEKRDAPIKGFIETAPLTAEKRTVVTEPVALPRVEMGWLSPAAFAKGDADADMLASILGNGKASRLHKKLVYEQQVAQDVAVEQDSEALQSMFTVSITGKPGSDPKKLEAAAQAVLDEIRAEPPSLAEVQRGRNILLTRMVWALQNQGGFGGKADMLNRYNQYVGDPGYLPKDLARYNDVTPQTVQALAKTLLDPTKRAVVITVPKT